MKESILPIDLDNLGFIKDDEFNNKEYWLYELDNNTIQVELSHYKSNEWTLSIFNATRHNEVEVGVDSLTQIKNLIKALQ
jgi:hypothetical protein